MKIEDEKGVSRKKTVENTTIFLSRDKNFSLFFPSVILSLPLNSLGLWLHYFHVMKKDPSLPFSSSAAPLKFK